jgi:iron-sulfur cluster repair protein YtfE (RIC family)
MTIHADLTAGLPTVTFDLYRDIHKGIRAELFSVTETAGTVDAGDRFATAALADHVRAVADLLELHAHHEDEAIDPALQTYLPALAEQISTDHLVLDRRITTIVDMTTSVADAPAAAQRRLVHQVYLDLASFVSSYLEHQDLEERVVMPSLEQAIGVDAVVDIHHMILAAIPPEVMMRSLALMLPAMNVDDRAELLGGMKAAAPPDAFDAVVGLAESVLRPADFAAVTARILR